MAKGIILPHGGGRLIKIGSRYYTAYLSAVNSYKKAIPPGVREITNTVGGASDRVIPNPFRAAGELIAPSVVIASHDTDGNFKKKSTLSKAVFWINRSGKISKLFESKSAGVFFPDANRVDARYFFWNDPSPKSVKRRDDHLCVVGYPKDVQILSVPGDTDRIDIFVLYQFLFVNETGNGALDAICESEVIYLSGRIISAGDSVKIDQADNSHFMMAMQRNSTIGPGGILDTTNVDGGRVKYEKDLFFNKDVTVTTKKQVTSNRYDKAGSIGAVLNGSEGNLVIKGSRDRDTLWKKSGTNWSSKSRRLSGRIVSEIYIEPYSNLTYACTSSRSTRIYNATNIHSKHVQKLAIGRFIKASISSGPNSAFIFICGADLNSKKMVLRCQKKWSNTVLMKAEADPLNINGSTFSIKESSGSKSIASNAGWKGQDSLRRFAVIKPSLGPTLAIEHYTWYNKAARRDNFQDYSCNTDIGFINITGNIYQVFGFGSDKDGTVRVVTLLVETTGTTMTQIPGIKEGEDLKDGLVGSEGGLVVETLTTTSHTEFKAASVSNKSLLTFKKITFTPTLVLTRKESKLIFSGVSDDGAGQKLIIIQAKKTTSSTWINIATGGKAIEQGSITELNSGNEKLIATKEISKLLGITTDIISTIDFRVIIQNKRTLQCGYATGTAEIDTRQIKWDSAANVSGSLSSNPQGSTFQGFTGAEFKVIDPANVLFSIVPSGEYNIKVTVQKDDRDTDAWVPTNSILIKPSEITAEELKITQINYRGTNNAIKEKYRIQVKMWFDNDNEPSDFTNALGVSNEDKGVFYTHPFYFCGDHKYKLNTTSSSYGLFWGGDKVDESTTWQTTTSTDLNTAFKLTGNTTKLASSGVPDISGVFLRGYYLPNGERVDSSVSSDEGDTLINSPRTFITVSGGPAAGTADDTWRSKWPYQTTDTVGSGTFEILPSSGFQEYFNGTSTITDPTNSESKDGKYRVYCVIEDEFGQLTAFNFNDEFYNK